MKHLRYNGCNFRILQLTDIHLEYAKERHLYDKTMALIEQSVRDTSPDLVIITGDIAWGLQTADSVKELSELFDRLGVLWAPVLGNHDGRPDDCDLKSREEFASLLNGKFCLFENGNIADSYGNYIITLGDDEKNPDWALFMLDSHEGEFFPSQINWYSNKSREITNAHSELAFFHVPIPEYLEVWDYEECVGFNMENVCHTDLNDGLFAAMVRSNSMKGVFVGHDHINDFEGTLRGIRLCYGRGSGNQCYTLEGYPLGARIIDLEKGKTDFSTKIYLEGGEIYEQKFIQRPKLRRK